MDTPTTFDARSVAPDTFLFPSYLPLPGLGVLPINSYLIRGAQPVLIDTGIPALRDGFLKQLQAHLDLADLQWIWLTHTDPDHIGALSELLRLAPKARVVTSFLGMGKMGLHQPIPPDRVYLLNPGQSLDVGDRQLLASSPPTFDAPETVMALDTSTGALFSSDCFGATMEAPVDHVDELTPEALRQGQIGWATVDSPWLRWADGTKFRAALDAVADLKPRTIHGSHLPPTNGGPERFLEHLDAARSAPRFMGPDHAALMQMMAVA